MKCLIFSRIPFSNVMLAFAFLLPVSLSAPAQTLPCVETNSVKFMLPPQLTQGFDVKDSRNSIVLADDFLCTNSGPITDIHVWGSWLNDQHGTITNFWIGIYSDVPAVTSPVGGQILTNSHPGTLLWWYNFPQGQFSESIYASNAYEYFYNPTNGTLASDTVVYYYCFFPPNPFPQQGSITSPTNYWLAIRAQLTNDGTLYGWKSSAIPYHDPAVWGTVDTNGFPSGDWQSMTNPITQQQLDLSMMLTTPTNTPPPPVPCPETNGVKYVQWPNLYGGSDVWNNRQWMLADDFVCTNTGPISDIHLWGSWLNNQYGTGTLTFWLGIYDDVPVSTNNPYSHPGKLLWQQWFAPGQYAENYSTYGQEYFLDPGSSNVIGSDSAAWYYCFYPTNQLLQTGSAAAPKTYWLAAYAQSPSTDTTNQYGWKTTTNVMNDISVHAPWPGMPPTNNPGWMPTFELVPNGGGLAPMDLAFKITTDTNYNNVIKYAQWPDTNGFDVWNSSTIPGGATDGPWVLADDFVCTNTGYISDIHLWGSWWYDQVATNQITFWLGLFNDVPAVTNSSGQVLTNSHPGSLVWSQCFPPGTYSESYWSPASEYFMDPGPPILVGSDFSAWYYSFFPTNPPIQHGSYLTPKTYWVAAFAQLPTGLQNYFGWKTTTNIQHDISVHSPWTFGPCPTNIQQSAFGWTSTTNVNNQPVDLAFEISTITNCADSFLTIDRTNVTTVVVTWLSGTLQWSTNVIGPYTDVPGNPPSPFVDNFVPLAPTNQFFRVRCN